MTENDLNKLIVQALKDEKRKDLLKGLGLLPVIPESIEAIEDSVFYTTEEVADFLGYHIRTIQNLCRDNEIHSVQRKARAKHLILGEELKKHFLRNIHKPSYISKLAINVENKKTLHPKDEEPKCPSTQSAQSVTLTISLPFFNHKFAARKVCKSLQVLELALISTLNGLSIYLPQVLFISIRLPKVHIISFNSNIK